MLCWCLAVCGTGAVCAWGGGRDARAADQPPAAPATTPTPAPLVEAVVYLRDGNAYTGILVERTPERVVLRIAGINATFKADQVDRIRLLPTLAEQYAELRKGVDARDVEQVLRLVDWLVARQQLEAARDELEALRTAVPGHAAVEQSLARLLRRIDLRDAARVAAGTATPAGAADAAEVAASAAPVPPLTPEQIALMKVYEVDLNHPPRMDVPRAAVEAAMEANAGHPLVPATREGRDAVLGRPFVEQLDYLFRLRARDQYARVRLLDQPRSVRLFRDEVVRTWLAGSCATAACHGGLGAGRLVLSARRPNSDASIYTNLYILERFRTGDGAPLIDQEHPDRSALIQLGLPREVSARKHPVVAAGPAGRDRWRPAFRGLDDPRIRGTVEWISAMERPRPELPFAYEPLRPLAPPTQAEAVAPRPAEDVQPAGVPAPGGRR